MTNDDFRTLRKASGLTQEEFAGAIGVTREAVNRMEAGRAKITKRTELSALQVTSHHTIEKLRFLSVIACQ